MPTLSPTQAPLPGEDRRIWQAFRHHSRTFSLAALLLPRPVRMPVATLYLFCRTIDTIADERVLEVGAQAALAELERAEADLQATLAGHPPPVMLWRRLAEVHASYTLWPAPLIELIDGARWDLEGRVVDTEADLIHYSNLVGGSVGAMMLPFLVEDPAEAAALEEPARALGIAMQITNIVRDVGEDQQRLKRLYLPTTWLNEMGLTPTTLKGTTPEGAPPPAYPALLERAMQLAEAYFEEGMQGIGALPAGARLGIRAAARMYREIMNEVRARHYDNLTQRAYVPLGRKVRRIVHDGYQRRRRRFRPLPDAVPS
ncbi:MAG: phytoene/squalene synthase family protein [Bacteroidota bacterium]